MSACLTAELYSVKTVLIGDPVVDLSQDGLHVICH